LKIENRQRKLLSTTDGAELHMHRYECGRASNTAKSWKDELEDESNPICDCCHYPPLWDSDVHKMQPYNTKAELWEQAFIQKAAEMDQADLQINGTDLDQHVEAMLKDRSLPYHLKAVLAILLED
uniref:SAM domain-containing protein n=1 Tax=Heligmosomoides polygyrus TaxID=6339 RepID=A0A183F4C9_HELPZ